MNLPSLISVAVAGGAIAVFVAALFLLSLLVPGRRLAGVVQPDGRRHLYTLNGLALFLIVLAAVTIIESSGFSLGILLRWYWALFVAANIMAFAATGLMMWLARGTVPIGLRSYYYGALRDPTLFGIDLKLFSYRPSLIGLALFNIACATYQREATGTTNLAMALYLGMSLIYVANYFQFEYGMIFTWDIVEERFGWMLIWGDYVLVPFFYCIPGMALAFYPVELSSAAAGGLGLLFAFGFWLFRGANQQKHDFKSDPNTRIWGRPARKVGGRLLASGFWGIGRKLNYTGEICIYLAWTLPAGLAAGWPWLLPAWLIGLLIHRAWRDDVRCRMKYGALWDEYCALARFRMIPLLY
jgi:delta14-sterol reductase